MATSGIGRVLEYSIRSSTEYSRRRKLDLHSPTVVCQLSLQFSDEAMNLSTGVICSRVAESLDSLLTTRSKFIDTPLFHSDLSQLLSICEHWTFLCLTTEQRALTPSLSNQLLHLWSITDLLFNSSETFKFKLPEDFSRYNF